MVIVYAADISSLPDPALQPQMLEHLSPERRQKALHLPKVINRKQSAAAGLLLNQILHLHGISGETVYYGENGKPEIRGISFNLSHSQQMVVCAVSDRSIGCDIEQIQTFNSKIAQRFFTDNERRFLFSLPPEQQNHGFYRLWTMKESYIKMTGEGLGLSLQRFEARIGEDIRISRDGALCTCRIKEYLLPDYCLSVCAEEPDFAPNIQWVSLCDSDHNS